MKIVPVAFDSFGVRSMATMVVTKDVRIFIDPGAALGPTRYGLPPRKEELLALEASKKLIIKHARKCDVIIVTHYHYDHHPYPEDTKLYGVFEDKHVLCKHISKDVNLSGKQRGKIFYEKVREIAREVEFADNRALELGGTKIEISPAVWHGDVGSKVGKVVMVCVKEKDCTFVFGSDAQGLADPNALKWFMKRNPDIAIIDGYPTIFLGWRMSARNFERSKENLRQAIRKTKVKKVVLDHHIVRDVNYREKIKEVFEAASESNKQVLTAAEFYGLDNLFLEAWRNKLGREIKVSVEGYYRKLSSRISRLASL